MVTSVMAVHARPSPASTRRPAAPLVTVVLPTHDRPDGLRAALQSVLAQTHQHLQVVVVDDGSREPVDSLVGEVVDGDTRVSVVRRPTPGGASMARNAGLRLARGRYVAFLDDDDLWRPDKLARQVAVLRDHPDVVFVTCDYLLERPGRRRFVQRYRGPSGYSAQQLLWVNFPGSFSFVMVNRQLAGDELLLDEAFPSVEDWDLWFRCSRRGPMASIPEPLARYVCHRGPRLTDPGIKKKGLEAFAEKHASAMSEECLAFHQAHQLMDTGVRWKKRFHVSEALLRAPRSISGLLLREQAARQLGRLRGDPGLTDRVLASAVAP